MAQSKYENVRQFIASVVCKEDFEIIDEAMSGKQGAKLMIGPANANIGGWGKADTDLQTDMSISGSSIKGTLKYIAEQWTAAGFSADDHYFVYLKVDTTLDQTVYDIKVGINNLSTLDGDKDIVVAVKKNSKKPVRVLVVKKSDESIIDEDTYTLNVAFEPATNA